MKLIEEHFSSTRFTMENDLGNAPDYSIPSLGKNKESSVFWYLSFMGDSKWYINLFKHNALNGKKIV